MNATPAPYHPSRAELLLIHQLRAEADADFSAQFEQERFLDWSRLARRGSWRAYLALHIETRGASWALGWIGGRANGSEDREFWMETIPRVRAVA